MSPFVQKVLLPLRIQSSPSNLALVCIPATSEPAPDSVIACAPIFSPEANGLRYFCFCSSVPKAYKGIAINVWATGSVDTAQLARASSSITIAIDR